MSTKQEPSRRNDVIRCEQCGEDYSVTYKCCPFCDERPGRPRAGTAGRRVAGGANPLQVIGLVISLALIIAALFIVFTTLSPLLNKDNPVASQSQPSSVSQSDPAGSTSDSSNVPDSSSGDISQPENPPVTETVNSIALSRTDFTLQSSEHYIFKVTVDPADAKVTWTSSNEDIAFVDENGIVTNVNTGSSLVKVTITATAGDKSAECDVYCRGGSTGVVYQPPQQPDNSQPDAPTPDVPQPDDSDVPSTVNKTGTVTGAGSGLNIRSGPGSSNEAIASLPNGASVTILEDTGTGWYKITFSGAGGRDTEGYVSKDYITVD